MTKVIAGILIVVGLINAIPIMGMFGTARLTTLYGLTIDEVNILILMRHRAVMLGMIGAFMVYAAFNTSLTWLGIAAGLLAMGTFIIFAMSGGAYNSELKRLVYIDTVAIVLLLVAAILKAREMGKIS